MHARSLTAERPANRSAHRHGKHYASLPHSHYEPHSLSQAADQHSSRAATNLFPALLFLSFFLHPIPSHFIPFPFLPSQFQFGRQEHGCKETAKAANSTTKKIRGNTGSRNTQASRLPPLLLLLSKVGTRPERAFRDGGAAGGKGVYVHVLQIVLL